MRSCFRVVSSLSLLLTLLDFRPRQAPDDLAVRRKTSELVVYGTALVGRFGQFSSPPNGAIRFQSAYAPRAKP
jgi:hypothetical protein